jgi:hypothetical protein
MPKIPGRVPVGLLVVVVILLLVGALAGPVIHALASADELASNVLLSALPFILIFAAIILTFIGVIAYVASLLNHRLPERIYRPIESLLIAGIVLGVVGMFQPWLFILYQIGFGLLLFSTLGFILWSHVIPHGPDRGGREPGLHSGD